MPAVTGLKSLQKAIAKSIFNKTGGKTGQVSVIVGYTANYALHVHENLEMKSKGLPRRNGKGLYWDPQGRAKSKFLEDPARRLKNVFGKLISMAVKRGATMTQALLIAGLRLQRESMLEVPVDTGNLKASAFTVEE